MPIHSSRLRGKEDASDGRAKASTHWLASLIGLLVGYGTSSLKVDMTLGNLIHIDQGSTHSYNSQPPVEERRPGGEGKAPISMPSYNI